MVEGRRAILLRILILFGCTGMSLTFLKAQNETVDDAAFWATLNLEKKLNSPLTLRLSTNHRIDENLRSYQRGNMDVGLRWKLNESIQFTGGYAFLMRRMDDYTYRPRHYVYLAMGIKKQWGRYEIQYRNMVQARFLNGNPEKGQIPVWIDRNKLTLQYELNKFWSPFISQEVYLPFYQATNRGLSRSRSSAGLEYTVNRSMKLSGWFMLQLELNATNAQNRDFIWGLEVSKSL